MKINHWTIFLLLMLAGCHVAPKYAAPEIDIPENWHTEASNEMNSEDPARFVWWESFQDPILNSLIQQASRQNWDLFIAGTRILEARQLMKGKSADIYPHIDASITTGRLFYSKDALVNGILDAACPHRHHSVKRNIAFFELGFDANWEIDLFGVNEHAVNALEAKMESAEESFCDVWVTVSAEVARNYIELRSFQQRLSLIQKAIDIQNEKMMLTQDLLKIGIASTIDFLRMQEQLDVLEAQKSPLEQGIDLAIHRLSVLLGNAPGELYAELCHHQKLPHLPCNNPIGLPSELLRRRPDIRRAERELAAASESLSSAIAELYPRFSLYGFLGSISTQLKSLTNSASFAWFLAPQVLIPVFNSQLLTQDADLSRIQARQALFAYQKKVIDALEEVENSISSFGHEKQKNEHLIHAEEVLRQAYGLQYDLYERGVLDYLEVLNAENAVILAEDRSIQSQTQLLIHFISLYKALGGCWECKEST